MIHRAQGQIRLFWALCVMRIECQRRREMISHILILSDGLSLGMSWKLVGTFAFEHLIFYSAGF